MSTTTATASTRKRTSRLFRRVKSNLSEALSDSTSTGTSRSVRQFNLSRKSTPSPTSTSSGISSTLTLVTIDSTSTRSSNSLAARLKKALHPQKKLSVASPNATLTSAKTAFKVLKDIGESLPTPWVSSIAGIALQIIEIREQILWNKTAARDLIDRVAGRSHRLIVILQEVAKHESEHSILDRELGLLKADLAHFERLLFHIHRTLSTLTRSGRGLFSLVAQRDRVKQQLQELSGRLEEFDRGFMFTHLATMHVKLALLHERGQVIEKHPDNSLEPGHHQEVMGKQ